jgi:phosphohistidine phosphatase
MSVYLVQHGISLKKDVDPERGLSEEGIAEVERIAAVAKNYEVTVSRIEHSGKKRARQTAEIIAFALIPGQMSEARDGLNPLDDVAAIARRLHSADNLMLVGHLPFMERLTAYLITGSMERTVFRFQNGGILCMDQDPDACTWHIKWTLMPHIG